MVQETKQSWQHLIDLLKEALAGLGLDLTPADYISKLIFLLSILALCVLADFIAKKIIQPRLLIIIHKSRYKWDTILEENKVFDQLRHFIPGLFFYLLAYLIPEWTDWIHRLTLTYMVLIIVLAINSLINAIVEIYNFYEVSRAKPIKGYFQIIKIIVFFIGVVLMISMLMKESPTALLTGLGAVTAILVLIFKDTLLCLIASYQIASNDMVHIGDWISFEKYHADGEVIDMTLHVVKVQNWDKSISTIPTYSFLSDSFKNWRGMLESGGRRIKRAINIDMNSVRYCPDEMIAVLARNRYLSGYINTKKDEMAKKAEQQDELDDFADEGITNLSVFRAYLINYLQSHPMINNSLHFHIRHLHPGEYGLPLEVYVFSRDKDWANYEAIQAEIFDHILAIIHKFDLRVYQLPVRIGENISS